VIALRKVTAADGQPGKRRSKTGRKELVQHHSAGGDLACEGGDPSEERKYEDWGIEGRKKNQTRGYRIRAV